MPLDGSICSRCEQDAKFDLQSRGYTAVFKFFQPCPPVSIRLYKQGKTFFISQTIVYGPICTIRLSYTIVHCDVSDIVTNTFRTYCYIDQRILNRNCAIDITWHTPERIIDCVNDLNVGKG